MPDLPPVDPIPSVTELRPLHVGEHPDRPGVEEDIVAELRLRELTLQAALAVLAEPMPGWITALDGGRRLR